MKTAVLLSGGVDSSVALHLAKQAGHNVTAFYLKIWLEDELSYLGDCPWLEDLEYAHAVCKQTGVTLEVVPFQRQYWDTVVAHTIAEIKAGRTPNPDIMCNSKVKFGAFYEHIGHQFDQIITGHYAHVTRLDGFYHLYKTPDAIKDQTYFLSALSQEQLSVADFPLGLMTKEEVRASASQWNLPTKNRKDSQGICFLGKIKFSDFVRHHVGTQTGELREYESDTLMGHHEGFWYYTIGQRHSIRLSGGPWYVVHKDIHKNIVYISRMYYAADKHRKHVVIDNIHWIGKPLNLPFTCDIKLRHGAALNRGLVYKTEDNSIAVDLEHHDQGIAPGQRAVLYDGMRCVGSGTIIASRLGKTVLV